MKGHPFAKRAGYALAGWREAFKAESSFRIQVLAACLAAICTAFIAPSLIWWAIIVLAIVLVLATELINTALERTLDGLHPQQAEFIRQAKDCAAGAVLLFSCAATVLFALMLFDSLGHN